MNAPLEDIFMPGQKLGISLVLKNLKMKLKMLAASRPVLKIGQKSKNKNLKKLILCRVEGFLFDFELTSMMMILGHLLEDS